MNLNRVWLTCKKAATTFLRTRSELEVSSMPENICYVLDIGSRMLRCGLAGDLLPRIEYALVVPTPTHATLLQNAFLKTGDVYTQDFSQNSNSLSLFDVDQTMSVVSHGRIVQLRHLQRSLIQCFKTVERSETPQLRSQDYSEDVEWEMLAKPSSLTICMSSFCSSLVPIMSSSSNRSNTLQQLIEWCFTKGFERCQLVPSPLMSMYAVGCSTGLVVDVGYESSRVTPIAEGQCLPETCHTRLMKGGRYVTECLHRSLVDQRIRFATPYSILEHVKKKACFVSLDFSRDMKLAQCTSTFHQEWKLPDNTRLVLGKERFTEPEHLFCSRQDSHDFLEGNEGLPDIIGEAIRFVPLDLRRPLLKCVVLCGGGSLLPGFVPRLEKEIRQWYSLNIMNRTAAASNKELVTTVIAPSDRDWLPFRGASLFAKHKASHTAVWVTKQVYREKGMQAFHTHWVKSIL